MKIYDINNNILSDPDLTAGYLETDKILVAHHPATQAVEEQFHYETITEYPNGGKDVRKVIDVAGVEAREAWDEYEAIYRYIEYTAEQLAAIEEERNKPTTEERLEAVEAALLEIIMGGVTV